MLNEQNAARTRAGVPPLAWDATLADHARAYARELARTGRFEHADQPLGPGREGENLWTGTRDAYGYDQIVAHWVDEQRFFSHGITPVFRTTFVSRAAFHSSLLFLRAPQLLVLLPPPTSLATILLFLFS